MVAVVVTGTLLITGTKKVHVHGLHGLGCKRAGTIVHNSRCIVMAIAQAGLCLQPWFCLHPDAADVFTPWGVPLMRMR